MESFNRNLLVVLALFCICLTVNAQPGTWAWMHGSQTGNCLGVFGTQGVPAPSNSPPCLYETAHWTDQSGNFWMFGGLQAGFDMYADMWKFDPTTNMWTWMNGPQTPNTAGVYGTQGIPAPGNYPGARSYGANCWVDNNGDLWLFGGYGYDAAGWPGGLSDLWKYDVNTNQWTWMKGPISTGANPIMGIMGVPSPTNRPPITAESNCTWVDANNNLWFFGGVDINFYPYDQVWRYNPSTNEWTWMKGNLSIGTQPVYGALGIPTPNTTPGARGTYASWKDCAGEFWMYGGTDFVLDVFADLWKFDPNSTQWTWMGGTIVPNVPNAMNTTCTPSTLTFPGSRWENRAVWVDAQGRLWGFGGSLTFSTFDCANDLWCYNPSSQAFTWVSGSNSPNPIGVYGTLGVGAPGNVPSGRAGTASFKDSQGNLWIFGGYEFGAGQTKGDLWKFIPDPQCPAGSSGGIPSASFSAQPTSGCAPLTVTFTNTSTNAASNTWDFDDGSPTSSTISPSHTFTNPGSYDVMLIVEGGNCAVGSDTAYQTIVVSPGFPLSLGPDQTLCQGDSLLLDAGNPGSTYLWSDNTSGQTLTVSATGTYWVQVTNAAGCIHRDSIVVTVLSVPFSLGPDRSICAGSSITLDAGNPGSTYLWSNSDQTQTTTISSSGNHWVMVTLPTGCILRDTIAVTLLPLPLVSLGPDHIGCLGSPLLLDAGTHPGASIWWSTNATSQTISVATSGQYWVQVTDAAGCVSRDTINTTFNPSPVVSLGQDSTICQGSSLTLDAGNPGNTYLWSTGATTQTITADQSGQYTVLVTTPDGCTASGSLVLTVTPDFTVDLGPDTTFCEDRHWTLNTALPSLNGFTHLWSTGQQTERITVTESGTYTVQVANPCFTHDDAIQLTFRSDSAGPFIPTAFTPNGDGLNDVLLISGLHTDDRFNMQVYDRWGMRIFTTDDPRHGWDGTLHNLDSPEGIYVIRLQVTDCRGISRPRQASVTLIR